MRTSWEQVSGWYDDLLKGDNTYQEKVILPNLLRMLDVRKGERVLDIACGQGFFSGAIVKAGGRVTGVDLSASLIALAKKNVPSASFKVGSAERLSSERDASYDAVVIVLALQNVKNAVGALAEASRILAPSGRLIVILNHPAFRIPGATSWGFDEKARVQYRRADAYLSERAVKIDMTPGGKRRTFTVSFHRPLQYYVKALRGAGLSVTRLEEWISHRTSGKGPRKAAEDAARKEFPLFLAFEARKAKA